MKLEIYDPAMCCPTGVCGPTVDPVLARVASALFILEGKGFYIKRHNLGSEPQAFIDNKTVNERLEQKGPDVLPLIILNGDVVKEGTYPTNEELAKWFQIEIGVLVPKKSANQLL
ncbi:MAG: transcriptional regulator [Neobacillus sp.]|jgi:hypothetical protein|nr:transcriptional regulator [Neobacillus sp.]